jgi:hypothetical protein
MLGVYMDKKNCLAGWAASRHHFVKPQQNHWPQIVEHKM